MDYTVNEAMEISKALRGRLAELSQLRALCSTTTSYYTENKEKIIKPEYDVKLLDACCVDIENCLFQINSKIKQSNAITKISIDKDAMSLLKPLS